MAAQIEGGKIEFIEYHLPDLADGDYTVTITQKIEAKLTETTASFITPNIGSNVTVSVQNSQSIARGSTILIQGAGAYSVISVPNTTSITVQNLGSAGKKFDLPIRTADELVYYDDTYGMFDVSYAAAWELGRLLALQSKSFAINLYRWKRSHIRKLKDAETQLASLPFDGPTAALELPEIVSSWFENLILLEGVPFSYLVPDERMLPAESIRFFQIDPIWIECLVDGAFSIGRVLESDHELDRSHKENHLDDVLPERSSGFLLRSDVVAGWPDLQVDGYDEPIQNDHSVLQKVRLFELNPADCVSDLNQKRIAAQLEEKFRQGQIQLSKERCT
jgi:hypothetical protein